MRDQSAGGDKEDSGLPGFAVQTPSNFLRSTGAPLRLLNPFGIAQQAQADFKGKVCQKFRNLEIPKFANVAASNLK